MTNPMVELLVAARSSMVKGIKQNFVSSSVRTKCPLLCRNPAPLAGVSGPVNWTIS